MTPLFPPRMPALLPIDGTDQGFPVSRIFCVGRNYAAHAAEMGDAVDREAPFYFTKSAHAILPGGSAMPYAPRTSDLQHEVEFVVAIGPDAGVFGYACGLDMTRRDLQLIAKDSRRPWDVSKDFENAAVIGTITPAADFGPIAGQGINLSVNDQHRQTGTLDDMVWSVPEIIGDLSTLYTLAPGDLIMTGTPAGVGPVVVGDVLVGQIDGLHPVQLRIS